MQKELDSMTKTDKQLINALLEAIKIISEHSTKEETENALQRLQDVLMDD